MIPQTLLEIIADLEPELRRRLSQGHIDFDAGAASVTLSFLLHTPPRGRIATLDINNLPEGVIVTGFERWPDITRTLALSPSVGEQLADLDTSGIVGRLDVARFQPADLTAARAAEHPPFRWIFKTHAGSNTERTAWIKSLL